MEKDAAPSVVPTGKEKHEMILQELCRICGNMCITNENEQSNKKILPHAEIYPLIVRKYSVDISTDQKTRHPPFICYSCFWRLLYEKQWSEERPVRLASWPKHTSSCEICHQYKVQCKRQESFELQGQTSAKRQKTQHEDNQPSDLSQESGTKETPQTPAVSATHPVESPTMSVSRSDTPKTTKSTDPLRRTDATLKRGCPRSVGVEVSRSEQTQGDPENPESDYLIIPTSSKQESTNNAGVKVIEKNSKGKVSCVSPSLSVSQETSAVVTTSRQSNSSQSSAPSDEVIELPTPASNKTMQAAAPQSTTPTPNKTAQLTTSTPNELTTPTPNKAPQSTTPTPNKTAQLTTSTPNELTTPTPNKSAKLTNPTKEITLFPPTLLTSKVMEFLPSTSGSTTKAISPTPPQSNTTLLTTHNGTAQLNSPTQSNPILLTTPHGTAQLTSSTHKTAKLTTPTPSKTKQLNTCTPTCPIKTVKLTTPTPSKTKRSTTRTKKTAKLTTPTPSESIQLTTLCPNTTAQVTSLTGKPLTTGKNQWSTPLSKNKSLQYAIPNLNKTFQVPTTTPDKMNQASRKVLIRWVVPPASSDTTKSSSTPASKKAVQLNPFATNKTSNNKTTRLSTPDSNDTTQEVQPDISDEFLNYILQRPLIAPLTKKMEKIATHLFQTKLRQSGGACMTADFQTDDQNITALLVPGTHKVNTRNAKDTAVESQKSFLKCVKQIIGEFEEQTSPNLCRNCVKKDQLINKYRIALYEEKKRRKRERQFESLVREAQPAQTTQSSSISSGPASSSKPPTDTTTNNTSSRRARQTRSYDS